MWENKVRLETIAGPATTLEMANDLERAGASIVAITPHALPRFATDAPVDLTTACAVRDTLRVAKLCLLLDGRHDGWHLQHLLLSIDPDFVALDVRHIDVDRTLPIVRSARADLLLYGAALDYDEDPSWMEERLQSLMAEWTPAAIVMTLFPGLKSPIAWLRSEAGVHDEDVSMSDIERLLVKFPVILNAELTEADVVWLRARFAGVRGFAFLAGSGRNDGGCPVFATLDTLAGLLDHAVRGR